MCNHHQSSLPARTYNTWTVETCTNKRLVEAPGSKFFISQAAASSTQTVCDDFHHDIHEFLDLLHYRNLPRIDTFCGDHGVFLVPRYRTRTNSVRDATHKSVEQYLKVGINLHYHETGLSLSLIQSHTYTYTVSNSNMIGIHLSFCTYLILGMVEKSPVVDCM